MMCELEFLICFSLGLLLLCQDVLKRPTTVSKETYCSVKTDLLQCQKRPTAVSKETYYSVKRDLLQRQEDVLKVSALEHFLDKIMI